MKKLVGIPYDWNVICQVCREKIKASESARRWDGLIVGANHPGCFENRHPLDYPAPKLQDQRPLPFTSPEPTDQYVSTFCTVEGRMSIAGLGIAGCIIAGNNDTSQLYDPSNGYFPS